MKRKARPKIAAPERRLAAVVLDRRETGEADLVATFLTREFGLVTAIAKNARLSRRRFGGGLLDPARAAWYYFKINPNSDLSFVARGENNPLFPLPPPEPLALALSSFAVELVKSFEAPRNPAPLSFNLLVRHLSRLARAPKFQPPALEARRLSLGFVKCYLDLAGYGASLASCRNCGKVASDSAEEDDWALIPKVGSALCPTCRDPRSPKVPGALVKALAAIDSHLAGPRLSIKDMETAEEFFAKVASHAIDREFKSLRVLRNLLRENPTENRKALPVPIAGRSEPLARIESEVDLSQPKVPLEIINPASDKALSDNPASEKTLSDSPESDKALSDNLAGDNSASESPAIDKALSDNLASDKALSDNPASDKALSDNPASDKALNDNPASDKALSLMTADLFDQNEKVERLSEPMDSVSSLSNQAQKDLAQIVPAQTDSAQRKDLTQTPAQEIQADPPNQIDQANQAYQAEPK